MELTGEIKDIIYQNELNSYTICELETQTEQITIVGYLPFINVGDTVKLIGNYVIHKEYGRQFKVDTFEKLMPQTLDALERYLASGNIKGIGPSTAKKIVDKFGEETIYIFKNDYEKLSQIKGISKQKAQEMAQEFNEKWDLWQIVGYLERFGVSAQNSKKVYEKLGSDAIGQIEKNPYILTEIVYNVDFKQIDKMALDLGMDYTNENRIQSGIKYSLILATNNGNTCVIKENLLDFVSQMLNVDISHIENALIASSVKEDIVIEKREDSTWIYLTPFFKAEKNIAEKLINLNKTDNIKKIKNFNKKLADIEETSDIILSKEQKDAVKAINDNNVCIITGGPGTGKTTIIKTVIELYKQEKKKVVLCAPTGRAAKRITESTGEEAKTIHRLLEIGKLDEDDKMQNVDYQIAPIDADIIVIDEVSMVDTFIMNHIVKGIYLGTKLVLVGDKDQLSSVGPGNILDDVISSESFCTVTLNKIFRQAAKSDIIINAHNVNNGKGFEVKNENTDFFYINEPNQDNTVNSVISLCKERLKKYGNYDFFKDIQILTPTKKGKLGTKELNISLQKALNPEDNHKKEKKYGEKIFRQGDRVMQVKNNYDIYWEKSGAESGSGVFNGELGIITNILEEEKLIQIDFDDDKTSWYEYSNLEQLEHSYAVTIHKAQGSEFPVVIIVLPPSSPMLLTRNLLYTGITRAKDLLIIIGNSNIVEFMIQNTDSKKRNTGLEFKLKE